MMLSTVLLAVTGYLIDARGDVSLHRRKASQASPASVGSEVHAGDTIRVRANAKARILCPDLSTTWEPVPQSSSGVFEGCPETSERIRSRQGQQALGLRTADQAPWVLMPSNTVITTANPVIRWEAIPGATRYRVSVLSGTPPHAVWGPALVAGTNVRYTGKYALITGVEYMVRIEAEGGAQAEGKPFVVAAANVRTKIIERVSYFQKTISEPISRDIAMTVYLLNENLRADALSLLDRLTDTEKSAALSLLQARCLGEVGDIGAQRGALKRAVAEAEQMHDSYTEAKALLELAQVSKRDEAAQLSERAARLLQKLGIQQPLGDR
jgi:hypothetical protein